MNPDAGRPAADQKVDGQASAADIAMFSLIMNVAVSHTGVSVDGVISQTNEYLVRNANMGLNNVKFLGLGLASVGTIRDDFAKGLDTALRSLGNVGTNFAGKDGGNFRGWTTLGYILMHAMHVMSPAEFDLLSVHLKIAHQNFKRLVTQGSIVAYQSNNSDNPKDKKRDEIFLQAKRLFSGGVVEVEKYGRQYIKMIDAAVKAHAVKKESVGDGGTIGNYTGETAKRFSEQKGK
jgi:hypothetical protein